ncbi:hypothetical protein ACFWN1_30955 [Streptomyces sp. NPDC058459]|uniref:hypothetical protein n=1 Tax=Streptomyces sp. NPDC058459 TaxID=3346508 RepID=UPI00365E5DDC
MIFEWSLLHCLAGVLAAMRGQVRFEERVLGGLSNDEIRTLRRERFGFVFQYGELLPELTIEENTALRLAGRRKGPALAAARRSSIWRAPGTRPSSW